MIGGSIAEPSSPVREIGAGLDQIKGLNVESTWGHSLTESSVVVRWFVRRQAGYLREGRCYPLALPVDTDGKKTVHIRSGLFPEATTENSSAHPDMYRGENYEFEGEVCHRD